MKACVGAILVVVVLILVALLYHIGALDRIVSPQASDGSVAALLVKESLVLAGIRDTFAAKKTPLPDVLANQVEEVKAAAASPRIKPAEVVEMLVKIGQLKAQLGIWVIDLPPAPDPAKPTP